MAPLFLHIESNLMDETGFPVAIAWSLPDTRIKSVLITPEDAWLESAYEEANTLNADLQTLYSQGASCLDITRELEEDLDGRTVFVSDAVQHERHLDMIHEEAGREMCFEITDFSELFQEPPTDTLTALQSIATEHNLEIHFTQDHVMAMLLLARDRGYI